LNAADNQPFQCKLSFPNTGGTTVSSDTLSAFAHRLTFRAQGSESLSPVRNIIPANNQIDNTMTTV